MEIATIDNKFRKFCYEWEQENGTVGEKSMESKKFLLNG